MKIREKCESKCGDFLFSEMPVFLEELRKNLEEIVVVRYFRRSNCWNLDSSEEDAKCLEFVFNVALEKDGYQLVSSVPNSRKKNTNSLRHAISFVRRHKTSKISQTLTRSLTLTNAAVIQHSRGLLHSQTQLLSNTHAVSCTLLNTPTQLARTIFALQAYNTQHKTHNTKHTKHTKQPNYQLSTESL
jgi:hypothetical protein